jgi:hypothetical protein
MPQPVARTRTKPVADTILALRAATMEFEIISYELAIVAAFLVFAPLGKLVLVLVHVPSLA